ncbi:hypothetical protein C2S52_001265 [Perilla frutescens var. hirtella]|nr:hypothetical protein C2S52_001265 [Perilla frutescens var. hirtella]
MAASRLFILLGHSIIHNPRSFSQTPFLKFNTVCVPHSLLFKRCISSAVPLDPDASALSTDAVSAHPWPEWVNFVDQLKAKGYISQNAVAAENGDERAALYRDVKLVKDACLSFARDRFDIFKSLPSSDIQSVVEKGCPNVFRKSVNSAKRLRAHLHLDEGDACSSCSLRRSCDRAYVLLTESESGARTVDVVRILLSFALDPLVYGEVENKPPGRELYELSARRLLSMLVKLGETAPDPDLPKPASVDHQRKKPSLNLSDSESSKIIDMKPGDWVCSECSFMNFARNTRCLKCKENGPNGTFTGGDGVEMKKGDWNCPQCNFMNFARNARCLKCRANGPKNPYNGGGGVEMKKGDWNCPKCSFMNFASNKACFRCQASRPQRQLKPGDWECPDCDFMNFSKNTVCKTCNLARPLESAMDNGLNTRKKPF